MGGGGEEWQVKALELDFVRIFLYDFNFFEKEGAKFVC